MPDGARAGVADVVGGTLTDAVAGRSLLTGVTLRGLVGGGELLDVELDGCRIESSSLTGTSLRRVVLRECTFISCDLTAVQLVDVRLVDCRFVGCKALGLDVSRLTVSTLSPHPLDAQGCRLDLSTFTGLALPGSRLIDCSLTEADFTDADLRGADLTGSDLSGARFDRADLRGAVMERVTNLTLDARTCRVEGLRCSVDAALSIVQGLGIEVVPESS